MPSGGGIHSISSHGYKRRKAAGPIWANLGGVIYVARPSCLHKPAQTRVIVKGAERSAEASRKITQAAEERLLVADPEPVIVAFDLHEAPSGYLCS